jgi:hypothetical protein
MRPPRAAGVRCSAVDNGARPRIARPSRGQAVPIVSIKVNTPAIGGYR